MSSLSEWIGAQDLRGASMGVDDPAIDDRTAALEKRQEVLMTRSEKLDAVVAATQKALAEARGVGESESGAVKVTVDAQNRVVDIALTAKAMRLPSTDRLSRALLAACEAAVADVMKKLHDASGVAPDGDPLDAFFSGMPEKKASSGSPSGATPDASCSFFVTSATAASHAVSRARLSRSVEGSRIAFAVSAMSTTRFWASTVTLMAPDSDSPTPRASARAFWVAATTASSFSDRVISTSWRFSSAAVRSSIAGSSTPMEAPRRSCAPIHSERDDMARLSIAGVRTLSTSWWGHRWGLRLSAGRSVCRPDR